MSVSMRDVDAHRNGDCNSWTCDICEYEAEQERDELETCDVCPEYVNPDARCTHGRELCPEHLTACPECRADFAEDEGLDR